MTNESNPARSSLLSAPRIAGLVVVIAMIVAMRIEGRIWYCALRDWSPWISDVWTPHCSQHIADPYSFTHFTHGLIFYGFFCLVARRLSFDWKLFGAITIAAAWEVLENSPLIINRYRESTMSLDYLGDSVVNSTCDVLFCILGVYVARWIGLWRSLALFVAIEIGLLLTMRDNLTTNVIMLIHPIDAIKQWQSAGHV
ncbi:MAG: DUF2585 family protein [Planctomycetota bacterium]